MTRRTCFTLLSLVPAFLLPACRGDSPTGPNILILRSGTSFGFCPSTSYCVTTLEITRDAVVFVKTSRALGEVRSTGMVTDAEWRGLVAAVNEAELKALPAVIGCPDCADGGAEWIEVRTETWTERVTFPYNTSVAPIQDLVDRLRTIRRRFEANPI